MPGNSLDKRIYLPIVSKAGAIIRAATSAEVTSDDAPATLTPTLTPTPIPTVLPVEGVNPAVNQQTYLPLVIR